MTSTIVTESYPELLSFDNDTQTLTIDPNEVTREMVDGKFIRLNAITDNEFNLTGTYPLFIYFQIIEPEPEPEPEVEPVQSVPTPEPEEEVVLETPVEEEEVVEEIVEEEEEDPNGLGVDEMEPVMAKPPPDPPVRMVKPLGLDFIPPRKNLPVEVVSYDSAEDQFKRTEPTITNLGISKKGVLSVSFSNSMQMLDSWKAKYEQDKAVFTSSGKVDEERRRQLQAADLDFFSFEEKKAGSEKTSKMASNQILIKELTDKKIEI